MYFRTGKNCNLQKFNVFPTGKNCNLQKFVELHYHGGRGFLAKYSIYVDMKHFLAASHKRKIMCCLS